MQPDAPTSQPIPIIQKKNHKRIALWLLLGPTVLLVVTLSLFGFSNGLLLDFEVARFSVNIILFVAGVVGFLAWLPGIVIGLILLLNKK